MRMISSVPRRFWEMARLRRASSETTPPALRITWASPSSRPSTFAGSSRASMHATTASFFFGCADMPGLLPTLRLLNDSFPDDPVLDTAVSRAVLERVAAGELPETLRLARPGRMVAFGKLDVVGPAYPEAVRAARAGGYEAIERLAGGRAAVFHEGTLS